MPRDPRLYLWDIEQAITHIADQIKDRSFIEYSAERFVRQVVERNFEIIGEALVRLARHFPVEIEKIQHYRQFISFRNVIAHQYDGIDDAIVWQTATVSLPLLKEQVIALRETMGTP